MPLCLAATSVAWVMASPMPPLRTYRLTVAVRTMRLPRSTRRTLPAALPASAERPFADGAGAAPGPASDRDALAPPPPASPPPPEQPASVIPTTVATTSALHQRPARMPGSSAGDIYRRCDGQRSGKVSGRRLESCHGRRDVLSARRRILPRRRGGSDPEEATWPAGRDCR